MGMFDDVFDKSMCMERVWDSEATYYWCGERGTHVEPGGSLRCREHASRHGIPLDGSPCDVAPTAAQCRVLGLPLPPVFVPCPVCRRVHEYPGDDLRAKEPCDLCRAVAFLEARLD